MRDSLYVGGRETALFCVLSHHDVVGRERKAAVVGLLGGCSRVALSAAPCPERC